MPIVRKAADVAIGTAQVVRDLGRLREIVQVLTRHGFGWLVSSIEVPGVGLLRRLAPDQSQEQPTPERVTAVIRELGPTFVKLGQILSTREDIVPPAYIASFQSLQDAVTPISYDEIRAQIEASLGAPPEDLYASFDPEPLAAASIAQVHRARLRTGEDVAVKVQRPDIRRKIGNDLSILDFLGKQIDAQLQEMAVIDLRGVIAMLRRSISQEMDFNNEAASIEQFRTNFAEMPDIVIPQVYEAFVSTEVLTLEFIDGIRISAAREAGYDMQVIGRRYLSAAFKMLLEDGDFHGDLHPGNVLVLPGGKLGLLDFGMVGRLSDDMRADLIAIFFALQRRDYRTIARIYWELAIKPEAIDYSAWENDVQELMERNFKGRAMGDVQIADFLRDLLQGAARHRVRASPVYTMFFKALITTEGLAKMLIPEVDPLSEMQPYIERMVRSQYSPERLRAELFFYLTSFRYSARRLPMVTGQLLADLQAGRLRLRMVPETPPEELVRREKQINRVVFALMFVGLVLGSSITLLAEGPKPFGIPVIPILGFLAASGVAGWLAITTSQSRRG